MEHKPKAIVEAQGNAFAYAPQFADGVIFNLGERRLRRA
jgi:hypothetical protein